MNWQQAMQEAIRENREFVIYNEQGLRLWF